MNNSTNGTDLSRIGDTPSLSPTNSNSPTSTPSPSNISRSNSSPIQSDLPTLFSNLRANDSKGANGESTSKNLLKRFLSIGKSEDSVPVASSAITSETVCHEPNNGATTAITTTTITATASKPNKSSGGSTATDDEDVHRVKIPPIFLKDGIPLLKVSHKSKKRILLKIDPDNFTLSWSIATSANANPSTQLQRLLTPKDSVSSKKKYQREISIDDMKRILYQEDANNYREELHISKEYENTWFTLFYYNSKKKKLKTLHVIADSDHDFKRLSTVLLDLKRLRDEFAQNFFIDIEGLDDVRRSMILEGGKQIKQFLSFYDILKYSKRLNINVSSNYLRRVFNQVAPNDSTLDFEHFKRFVSILKHREDILEIYGEICGTDSKVMTYSIFRRFIKTVQLEKYTDDQIMKIFNTFCGSKFDYITPEHFNNFLSSKYNNSSNFIDEKKHDESTDSYFDKPLNEYFICSSHNTYLLGRQIAGDSSIEGYIKALQRGCRCVEIDVWDGPPANASLHRSDSGDDIQRNYEQESVNSEPIVSHGRTFTTNISFSNVLKTIKRYAFMTSPYPVIISLEVHCTIENQHKMIVSLKEILGDMLVLAPLGGDWFGLPSPNQLKHKILLKVKRTSESSKLMVSDSGKYYSATSTTTSFSEDNMPLAATTSSSPSAGSRKRSSSFSIRRKSKDKGKSKIAEELSDLGVYIQGLKFRNFSLPESKTFNHCFSISEKSLNSMFKDEVKRGQVDKHNRRYFMRVYPSKIRLTSSNFIPLQYWSHGVQMVATNWQTYDLGQQLNEAMFEGVNKTGYVIKPMQLRKPLLKSMRSPFTSPEIKISFCIEIISAHQLPKPKDTLISPFVSFEIIGASEIKWGSNSIKRTTTANENGFNPIWKQKFSGIVTAPYDLIFIRFLINSEFADEITPIGIVVARLADLKKGYRYLPINDLLGEELIYSQLFVRIDYQELT